MNMHDQGSIVVELYWMHAPRTCRNFAELAQRGYYDNTKVLSVLLPTRHAFRPSLPGAPHRA